MLKTQQFPRWFLLVFGVLLLASCAIPRKYPTPQPFVYKTNIHVKGDLSKDETKELSEKLRNQLDDSLQTRIKSIVGIPVLDHPPVFDTVSLNRSKRFMEALLMSQGYFKGYITDTFHFRKKKDQTRTIIDFTVHTGAPTIIDSFSYQLQSPALQALAQRELNNTLIKKGKRYTIDIVNAELERITTLFRNNGYFKLTRDDLYAQVDTVVTALIDPLLDPFEQFRILDSIRQNRKGPTITIVIKQRPLRDSSVETVYKFGNIRIYPDLSIIDNPQTTSFDSSRYGLYDFYTTSNKFKFPFIANHLRVIPGQTFRQARYYRILNNFNNLGAWNNVDFDLIERGDTLDGILRLYPAQKQTLSIDLEGSRNTTDILSSGQLFGVGLNFRLLNRNAFRESIQTSTTARFGIELGADLIQTLQTSLTHRINFPKFILPFKVNDSLLNPRTVLNLEGSYVDRLNFLKAPAFKTSWGYEWTSRSRDRSMKNQWFKTYQYIPFNFEYVRLTKTDSLENLEKRIPSLKYAYNDGLIISQQFRVNAAIEYGNKMTAIRGGIEESGALFGLIKSLDYRDLSRFIKLDFEFKHLINYKKSSLAFRAFAGYGFVYGKKDTGNHVIPEYNLPFFKAFFAGGPYSMRAWQVRRLGPGSAAIYDPVDSVGIDRFGNMQLEFNTEYRFNVATIAGVKVNSAFFVDIGNIWSKEFNRSDNSPLKEASFDFSRLYKDLAVGGGTSLRLDFDFFLIRFDWAYKLKNPRYAYDNSGWFHKIKLNEGQFQLGIGYPF